MAVALATAHPGAHWTSILGDRARVYTASSLQSANRSLWIFEPYTGSTIDEIWTTSMATKVWVGNTFTYHAEMRSSRIGINGPVKYSVLNTDNTSTDKAIINATTGQLTALKTGNVQVCFTYTGSPQIWKYSVALKTAGCRPYYSIESAATLGYSEMNCQGYAFLSRSRLESNYWLGDVDLTDIETSNALLPKIKEKLETNWLSKYKTGKWEDVTNQGGIDAELADNQWLVVMRVGLHKEIAPDNYDYHFWYRTDTGEWANKHGFWTKSQHLGSDLPTDNYSPGWRNGTYQNYYDSDLVYYRITQ